MQGVDLRKVCIQYSTSKTQSGGEGGMGYGASSLGIFGGQRTRADLGAPYGLTFNLKQISSNDSTDTNKECRVS